MSLANPKMISAPILRLCLAIAALPCAACFDASPLTEPDGGAPPRPESQDEAGPPPAEEPMDAGPGRDASVATPAGHDASPASHDASTDAGSEETTRHASCQEPLPALLPPSPGGLTDPPDAGSDELTCPPDILRSCSPEQPCPAKGDVCLHPTLGTAGVCEPHGSEASVFLSSAEGACLRTVSADTKRALCCAEVRGVDCREFGSAVVEPPSVPGQLCRVHEDCEAGLLCVTDSYDSWGKGWGRCLCPGVSADRVVNHRACTADGSPWAWGEPPLWLTASCTPALSAGWVVEKVAEGVDSPNFVAAIDASSRLHVLHLHPEGAQHLVRDAAGWTSELFTDLSELSLTAADLVVDGSGALHIANGAPYGSAPSYATNAGGSWLFEDLPSELGAYMVSLSLVAGQPLKYSFLTDYDGFFVGERGPEGWAAHLVSAEQIRSFTAVDASGTLGWVLFMQDGRVLWRHDEHSDPQLVLSAGSGSNAVLTRGGDLLVPYLPRDSGSVRLARVHGSEVSEREIWKLSDARFDLNGAINVSVALDANDRAFVVHGTPEGLVLESEGEAGFELTLLVPELESSAHTMTAPRLFIDGHGEPHILYWLDANTANRELRHVFRGSCATP